NKPGPEATSRSLGLKAYRFDVVSLWIEDERGIVGVMVLGSRSGSPVVDASSSQRRIVEIADGSASPGAKADVGRGRLLAARGEPQGALAADTEAGEC